MGHLTPRNYLGLQKRMDQFVPGIPDSKYLYEILKILFTDEEAKLCSVMPLTYFTIEKISNIWGKTVVESAGILKHLADKGLVYEFKIDGAQKYVLAPPILGFFEFSLMRIDGKFDRKKLSELYYKFINVENSFIKEYFSIYPQVSRMLVQEDAVENFSSEVLPYEKASHVIDSASCITVGTCFCRHKMEHMGMACDNPQDVCLTFNDVAEHVAKHGIARVISKTEAQKILNLCTEKGLAQIADNKKEETVIICNCCGCCCDLLLAYKRLGVSYTINPSNYIANISDKACTLCEICIQRCPINAISKINNQIIINRKMCLGCGICARFCPTKACRMEVRAQKPFIPNSTVEKIFLGAVYQGKLGNFIFDDQTKINHIILKYILNFFIKLAPIKKLFLYQPFYSRLIKILS